MSQRKKPFRTARGTVANLSRTALFALFALALLLPSPAFSEEWQNLVQPAGTLYSGPLNGGRQKPPYLPPGPLLTASEANGLLSGYRGYTLPPFWDTNDPAQRIAYNTKVTLTQTTKTLYFARVCSPNAADLPSGPAGSWVMRAATIRGLTAREIWNCFSLPNVPTHISYALVPAGQVVWTGVAGPIPSYTEAHGTVVYGGSGGSVQTFLDNSWGATFYGKDGSGQATTTLGDRALLYSPIARGSNAGSIAAYLDGLIPVNYADRLLASSPYGRLDDLLGPLDVLSFQDLDSFSAALNAVGPEFYDGFTSVVVRNDLLFSRGVGQRIFSTNGRAASENDFDPAVPSARLDRGPRAVSLWMAGLGEFGSRNAFGEHTGFDYNTEGALVGLDTAPGEGFLLGIAAAYMRSGIDWSNNAGDGTTGAFKLGAYSEYRNSGFFLDSLLALGYDRYSANRNITFQGVGSTASSDTTGYDTMIQLRGGRDFHAPGGWTLSPEAGISYIYLHRQSFTETGADALDLDVQESSASLVRTELGARAQKDFLLNNVQITPALQLSWAHEIPLDSRVLSASLAGQGGSFDIHGANGNTDSVVVDTALKARITGSLTLYTGYGAEVGEHFTGHQLNLRLRYDF